MTPEALQAANRFGAVAVFAGLVCIGQAWRLIFEVRGWRSWPSVTGRIVLSRNSRGPDGEELPVVLYEYAVGGRIYSSDVIWPGERPREEATSDVEALLSKYFVGANVTVFYNPKRPRSAFLEIRTARYLSGLSLLGFILSGLGWVIIVVAGLHR